jgi:stage II sporulation protein AA (anti-sigma F factor antagonist)
MYVSFNKTGSTLTVHLDGELDQHCACELRKTIDAKVTADGGIKTLLMDLGKIGFMDSSGIGVILGRYRLMRDRGGELMITNVQPAVHKLLKLSGVYSLLDKNRKGKANG